MKNKVLASAGFAVCFLLAGSPAAIAQTDHHQDNSPAVSTAQGEGNTVEYNAFFERTEEGSEYIHLELSHGKASLQEDGTVIVTSDNGELVEKLDTKIPVPAYDEVVEVSYEVSDDGQDITVSLPSLHSESNSETDIVAVPYEVECGLPGLLVGLGGGALQGLGGGAVGAALGALGGAITSGIAAAIEF
ncbi:hypothetical protein [Auritidibacter ignavus]|uniref:hypothetical protein n=1 Tax=Auritidibacter ignavus TaxID=678932 RepID=UPI0024B8DACF|nr:hypothetical protein [Auritidibacter ignavus]WHS27289.1 hypothetical protein QM395_07800 [Auritidibacter ignavus]